MFLLKPYLPLLHISALKPQDVFSVGSWPGSVCRTHTHTHHTSSTLIECRCFGFSRVIVAVGALKSLSRAVRGGPSTSVSHLFFKQRGWNCIPHSFPPSFFPPVHWESTDCKSGVCSIRVPLCGLRPALLHFLKSSVPECVCVCVCGEACQSMSSFLEYTHHTLKTQPFTPRPLEQLFVSLPILVIY